MRGGLLKAETLEMLRVPQHLAPLLAQGGALSGELLLPCHTHPKHLLGFLPSGNAAEGRQAQRNAIRILRLAHPVALGHTEERFDRIGPDWQADVSEPKCRGGLQLEVQLEVHLAPWGRTVLVDRRYDVITVGTAQDNKRSHRDLRGCR